MKKIISIILCLTLVLGLAVVASADGDTAGLVTSESRLSVGDQIVIVAAESDLALGTTQNNNNRSATAITKSGATVALTAEVQVLTLEKGLTDGTWALSTGSGYLTRPADGNNLLRTEDNITQDSSWTISIAANGVATIKSTSTNNRNWMRNNGNLFACYSSGQKDICIYKVGYAGDQAGEVSYDKTTVQGVQDIGADAYVEVTGVVTNVYYNSIYIQDSTGAAKVTFGENVKCAIGDTIVVKGISTANGDIVSATYTESSGMTLTAAEITYADMATVDIGSYVKLTGLTVTEVTLNEETGAVTKVVATDGKNTISTNGAIISGPSVAVGDVITIEGTLTTYRDSLWNASYTVTSTGTNNPDPTPSQPTPSVPTPSEPTVTIPEAGSTLTIPEAMEVATMGTDNKYYIIGTVTEITNTTYGNLYITDKDGNTILIYGIYSADGSTRFDAMENQPKVGDTITLYTVLTTYNGTPEAKNAWLVENGPATTADSSLLSVAIALMAVSAMGIAVVGSKKKEF